MPTTINKDEIGSQITAIINGAIDALVKVGATYPNAIKFLIMGSVHRFPGDDVEAVETLRALINRELTSCIIANGPDDPEAEASYAAALKTKKGWNDA